MYMYHSSSYPIMSRQVSTFLDLYSDVLHYIDDSKTNNEVIQTYKRCALVCMLYLYVSDLISHMKLVMLYHHVMAWHSIA